MGTNNIATLPNAAFATLNVTYLYLDYNSIRNISDFAFKSLGTVKVLHLQHNRLLVLPEALKYFLVNLEELDVSGNPIDGERSYPDGNMVDSFTDDVMTYLGNKLTRFTFGDPISLVHWPGTLTHLQKLKELHISGSIIKYFPPGAFSGFEHTIEKLWIEKTQLSMIPLGVGTLTRIKELYIDHNTVVQGDSVLVDSVFRDIGDTLQVLSLAYDNLTRFPKPIKYLANLKTLSLQGNKLSFINEESLYSIGNGSLLSLNLRNCGLFRIPGALSDLKYLKYLDLSENNIRTIESLDLVNLPDLVSVSLRGNPLKFISRTAFYRLPSVATVDLSNTDITEIPKGLQNLNALEVLDLTNAPVDCTCDIFWVKRWFELYDIRIEIKGQCETVDYFIQDYIDKRIPSCPQYQDSIYG